MQEDIMYQLADTVPHMTEADIGGERPMALHPCYFSFSDDCSIKASPEMDTSGRLVDGILNHSLITSSEPFLAFKMENSWPPTHCADDRSTSRGGAGAPAPSVTTAWRLESAFQEARPSNKVVSYCSTHQSRCS